MKKILSIVLTFALVLSMSLTVFASDYTVSDGDATAGNLFGAGGLKLEAADGSKGKAATDKVMRVTKQGTGDEYIGNATTFEEITSDYYVIEFNYMPKVDMSIGFNNNRPAAFARSVTQNHVFENQWNKVLIYIDYKDMQAGTSTSAKSYLFVNGGSYDTAGAGYDPGAGNYLGKPISAENQTIRYFKFHIYDQRKDKTQPITDVTADIDDFKMYSTNTLPDGVAKTKFTPITTGSLAIANKVATVSYGTTVAGLKAEYTDYKFVAYTDSAMTTEVADNVPLNASHTLAVEDMNNVIQPCTVVVDGYKTITNGAASEASMNITKLLGAPANGTMGKTATDKTLQLTINADTTDGYLYGDGYSPVVTGTDVGAKKYFVMKLNYKPENNTGIAFRTVNNCAIATPVSADNLQQGKWNSIMVYVDYTQIVNDYDYTGKDIGTVWKTDIEDPSLSEEELTELRKFLPVGYIYVNGRQVGSGLLSRRIRDRYGMCIALEGAAQTDAANTHLRIAPLYSANTTGSVVAEIDDFEVYMTDTLPDGAVETAMPTVASSNSDLAYADGNIVTVKSDADASLLTASEGTLSVVSNEAGDVASDLASAKYVFVTSGDKYTAYDVSVFGAESENVSATYAAEGSKIFVAEYAGNKLVNVTSGTAAADGSLSVPYTVKDAGNTVKAFFFGPFGGIRPLIGSLQVK